MKSGHIEIIYAVHKVVPQRKYESSKRTPLISTPLFQQCLRWLEAATRPIHLHRGLSQRSWKLSPSGLNHNSLQIPTALCRLTINTNTSTRERERLLSHDRGLEHHWTTFWQHLKPTPRQPISDWNLCSPLVGYKDSSSWLVDNPTRNDVMHVVAKRSRKRPITVHFLEIDDVKTWPLLINFVEICSQNVKFLS